MLEIIKDAYKSIEIMGNNEDSITVKEGNFIKFATENGEEKVGRVVKLAGKGEKTNITIIPEDSECKEIWDIENIAEGSLIVIK